MSPRRRRPGHRHRGFTLVEVVVAIALFSLLMTLVYGTFGTAVRAYEAGQERTDGGASLRVISEFLRGSLIAAAPVAVPERREWSLLFDGGDGRLHYVADLPGYVGVGGLHEIVIETEGDGDVERLMMRRRPLVFDRDGQVTGEYASRVLLDRVGGFEVRFFGSDGDDEVPTWRERWGGARRMPQLVELTIKDVDGGDWPLLRVRPRVDTIRYQGAPQGVITATPPPQEQPVTGEEPAPRPEGAPVPTQ